MTNILIGEIHLEAKRDIKNLLGEVFKSLNMGYLKVKIWADTEETINDLLNYVGEFSRHNALSVEKIATHKDFLGKKSKINFLEVFVKKKPYSSFKNSVVR